ncbi:MAG: class IV adenylate cyclase [Acidobacteriales bacterium]|nr:class IV adenylate cyclase [Terriglobales bacterium]
MPKEVEIKFHVADRARLSRLLRGIGLTLASRRTHEDNQLFDFPGARLRRRGELLRLRKYGSVWTLTHKGRALSRRHKVRTESETAVANAPQLLKIFAALGLRKSFRYEKFRTEWSDGLGHVVVDETPIGDFAEIEGPPRWIDATARKLAVRRADYITASYAGLFLDWKRRTGSRAAEMTWKEVRKK